MLNIISGLTHKLVFLIVFMDCNKFNAFKKLFLFIISFSGIIDLCWLLDIWIIRYGLRLKYFRPKEIFLRLFLNIIALFYIEDFYRRILILFRKFILRLEKFHFPKLSLIQKYIQRQIMKWLLQIYFLLFL